MKLDRTIKTIISMSNVDHFTVVEIRTAYLALKCDERLNSAQIRTFVYVEIQRLVRNGWLRMTTSEKRKITSYTKTPLFDPENLESTDEQESCLDISIHDEIKKDLIACNSEILECLGELEIYVELSKKHMQMRGVLKKRYTVAKERNHILKGKINTLNSLLKINYEN